MGPLDGEYLTPEQFRRHGAKGAIAKPFHPWHVLAAMRRATRASSTLLPPQQALPLFEDVRLDGRTILLVQDSAVTEELVRELLEHAGARVEVARDGLEAVERVVDRTYDAILMDLHMPKLDGFAATRAIRASSRHRKVPIIALTASARADDRRRCFEVGMNDLLSTPVDPGILLERLSEQMRARRTSSGLWLLDDRFPQAGYAAVSSKAAAEGGAGNGAAKGALDSAAAIARLGGRTDSYRRLLRRFAQSHAADARDVKDALGYSDTRGATRIAHTLASAAANIGATRLHPAAQALETVLRSPHAGSVAGVLAEFELAHAAALSAVTSVLDEEPAASDASFDPGGANVVAVLLRLETLLAQNDTAAVECLDVLRDGLGDAGSGLEPLERLAVALQAYDFAMARHEFEALRDKLAARRASLGGREGDKLR